MLQKHFLVVGVGQSEKERKNLEGLKYLIDCKICDVDNKIINFIDKGKTALHIVIEQDENFDNFDMIKMLLEKGASCDIQCDTRYGNGDTPLHTAARSGKKEIFKLLFDIMIDRHIDRHIKKYNSYRNFIALNSKRDEK